MYKVDLQVVGSFSVEVCWALKIGNAQHLCKMGKPNYWYCGVCEPLILGRRPDVTSTFL